MIITVIHGAMHKGITYAMTKAVLDKLGNDNEIHEFFMPADESEPETTKMTAPEEEAPSAAPSGSASGYGSRSSAPVSSYDESRERRNERYATIKATAQFQVVLVKASAYTAAAAKNNDILITQVF